MNAPAQPKIYHIVHVDRLPSILASEGLCCDATMVKRAGSAGTIIGMNSIKQRRLTELTLSSHSGLYVGQCVPFYFCPRSIMLYLLHCSNHRELTYRGGQQPIIHLEADMHRAVAWANSESKRWAFTLSNAGAYYFEDRADLSKIQDINWNSVASNNWAGPVKEGKQAEFLMEKFFPWTLFDRIGVHPKGPYQQVMDILARSDHKPKVELKPDWYY